MQESHNDGNRIDYDNIDYDDEEFWIKYKNNLTIMLSKFLLRPSLT